MTLLFSVLYGGQFVAHGKPAPGVLQAATVNTIEDTFTRANQTGWGTTTNPDGVPNMTWGLDGNGSKSFVSISNNTGVYAYPGTINVVGIASAGSMTSNGGDSLVKFKVSAVGHVTPYEVENACADKSCYYGARLHTAQNRLELAKRVGNLTKILTSVPFTASAATFYWMRLDVTAGASDTVQARIWADGSPEPASWVVTATDTTPLAPDLVGLGGTWDLTGTGESIQNVCYAYAASGLAAPCGAGLAPTATATPATPTRTATPTPAPPTPTTTATPAPPTPTTTATPAPPTPTATPAPIPPTATATAPGGSTPTPSSTPGSAVTVASDTFNRTVSNGWGSADVGGGWLIVDTPAHWSVAPGAGSITVSAGGEERADLSSVAVQDGEILARVVLPRSTQSNNCLAYVLGRFSGGSTPTYYRVGLGQGAGRSTIIIRAQRSDGTYLSPDRDTGIAAADGAVIWLRVQFQGTNPTAIRAHAWADGTTEPTAWTITTTDANAAEQVAGAVGVRARNEDSATAHTFKVASYRVTTTQGATATPTPAGSTIQHYMYVFPDGEMDVYDMDNNQSLVHRFSLPTSGLLGVAANPASGMLYLSECGSGCNGSGTLLAYSLITNTVVWTVTYPFGVDSMAITPDGKTIYMPDGAKSTDGLWHVLDAATGNVTGSIYAGVGGHNTSVSLNGAHVYLGGYQNGPNANYLQVADTATNTITKKIGPLVNGVRPFTINGKETLAFTTASNYLGFQVSSITTTQVLYTVPISGFTWTTFVSTAPSHGISLSPDEKEVYVMDGPNNYVHVFDVSGLPGSPPKQVADIALTPMTGNESPCATRCEKEGWLLHSGDGRFVYVGDSGDVIATATRKIVANLAPLANTRKFLEIDWQNGVPIFTTSRHGLGYVTN